MNVYITYCAVSNAGVVNKNKCVSQMKHHALKLRLSEIKRTVKNNTRMEKTLDTKFSKLWRYAKCLYTVLKSAYRN